MLFAVKRGLDGRFLYLVPEPPAPVVGSFMTRDAVDPGLQAGISVEVPDPAKNFYEDFLGGVGGVRGVVHQPVNQAVNRLVIVGDEPVKSIFRSRLQFGYDRSFFTADPHRSCEVAQGCYSRQWRTSIINRFGARNNTNHARSALPSRPGRA